MKASFVLTALALACLLFLPFSEPARANACASYPSSDCPARGVPPGASSYPCFAGQVKGDWNTGQYYTSRSPFYGQIGSGQGSDVSCYDYPGDAEAVGFTSGT